MEHPTHSPKNEASSPQIFTRLEDNNSIISDAHRGTTVTPHQQQQHSSFFDSSSSFINHGSSNKDTIDGSKIAQTSKSNINNMSNNNNNNDNSHIHHNLKNTNMSNNANTSNNNNNNNYCTNPSTTANSPELSSIYKSAATTLVKKMQDLNVNRPDTPQEQQRASTPLNQISPHYGIEESSPNASLASVGSLPPTLVASVLSRHGDLTPITRNTSCSGNIQNNSNRSHEQNRFLVSPDVNDSSFDSNNPNDTSHDQDLHGEHLMFDDDDSFYLPGPPIPPLRSYDRAQSVGTLDAATLKAYHDWQNKKQSNQHSDNNNNNNLDTDDGIIPPPALLDASRRFYSFTSRNQYEQQQPLEPLPRLQPYQPSRPDDWNSIGHLPQEELDRIFIARRRNSKLQLQQQFQQQHHGDTMLHNPIPMEERQWSIPSIRMANHLNGSTTTTSYTDDDDEESFLNIRYNDDDASLSSRASSLYLPDDNWGSHIEKLGDNRVNLNFVPAPSAIHHIVEPSSRDLIVLDQTPSTWFASNNDDDDVNTTNAINMAESSNNYSDSSSSACRKRKPREEKAMDWLESVQGNEECVAEAASSKFLLSPNRKSSGGNYKIPSSAATIASPQAADQFFNAQPMFRQRPPVSRVTLPIRMTPMTDK